MPKTKDAFAFADFDAARILQRPIFHEFGFEDDSDEKILSALVVTDSDEFSAVEEKNQRLNQISIRLSRLYDLIQRHADFKKGRLENLRRQLMAKIPAGKSSANPSLQAQIVREQGLLGFYTVAVLPRLPDLSAYVAVLLAQSEKALQAAYRRRFGERLKKARERAGLTQKEVAKKLNLTTSGYAFYERGEREVTILALTRLAKTFKVSTDNLLGL